MPDSDIAFLADTKEPFWKTYQWPLILTGVSVACMILSVYMLFQSQQPEKPIQFSDESFGTATFSQTITIDVEGAVLHPGLYDLSLSARVGDAISKAGGLTNEADEEMIGKTLNRAAPLSDGMKLYIPKKGGSGSQSLSSAGAGQTTNTTALISINSASESQLDTLYGVGPATAKKIIAGRPYNDLSELVSKKVLSQSVFDKIREQLSL